VFLGSNNSLGNKQLVIQTDMKSLIQPKNTYLILVTELIVFLFILSSFSVRSFGDHFQNPDFNELSPKVMDSLKIIPAADVIQSYLPLLKGKKIAVIANQTSVITTVPKTANEKSYTHLIDSLLSLDIEITKVFTPEHGFRGNADAGEKVADDVDLKTGLPLISLYGKNKKPDPSQLKDIDLVLFDIQDVGVRFYTYISTLSYVMEACSEQGIPVMVLDRPNPNGHYVDGPILEPAHSSFLGMHPVPLVYGLTIGEYAQMMNGEGWLNKGVKCELVIIPVKNYSHDKSVSLSIRPSPNLPNDQSINLYPSLGFFEGTIINAGRGTEFQFQRYGAPFFPETEFSYTPQANAGAKYPKFKGEKCYGVDLTHENKLSMVNLEWLIDAYDKTPKDKAFFGKTFTAHAGNENLQKQIESGLTAEEIRRTWQSDINSFKKIRKKYLIYP
jgi:uncharacterized protein YbbC (DUF1343 family)